ncbi:MAG: hypothetical protein AAB345_00985 [Patescibacteria group bacterium]
MTTKQLLMALVGGGLGFILVLLKPLRYDYDLPWVAAWIGAGIGGMIGWNLAHFFNKKEPK